MRSAAWTVERRCAIVILVRPARSPVIACRMSASDSGSTLDVASSRTRTPGLYTRALALAVRDVRPALAQHLAEPARQLGDEAGARGLDRARELRRRHRAVRTEPQIVLDAAREEHAVLEDDADVAAQARQIPLADIDAVHQDPPLPDVVRPIQQAGAGRLALAGRADDRHTLARRHAERAVAQHPLVPVVGEPDRVQLDGGRTRARGASAGHRRRDDCRGAVEE